jgi:hypothetical protein
MTQGTIQPVTTGAYILNHIGSGSQNGGGFNLQDATNGWDNDHGYNGVQDNYDSQLWTAMKAWSGGSFTGATITPVGSPSGSVTYVSVLIALRPASDGAVFVPQVSNFF